VHLARAGAGAFGDTEGMAAQQLTVQSELLTLKQVSSFSPCRGRAGRWGDCRRIVGLA